ncbi:MAG: sulfur carrier protein ThiS [Rhodoferax sp.]|nr:MAG: sulfur carrier protein ThiS [Rhodoferax sp.]
MSQATSAIAIQVNGELRTTTAATLHDWVMSQNAAPDSLATAVNGQFVPRTARTDTLLHAGDHILTFQPITGG